LKKYKAKEEPERRNPSPFHYNLALSAVAFDVVLAQALRRIVLYHSNTGKAHTWEKSWRGGLNEEDIYGGVDR
jgi:hypothetical protein